MLYRVEISDAALKSLARLPESHWERIRGAIRALAETPRPPSCRKMAGYVDHWCIRVGDYRVVYRVEDKRLLVLVVRVGHRRDVYRNL